jgi:hypothetical protein
VTSAASARRSFAAPFFVGLRAAHASIMDDVVSWWTHASWQARVSMGGASIGARSSNVRGAVVSAMACSYAVSAAGSARTRWITMPARDRRRSTAP